MIAASCCRSAIGIAWSMELDRHTNHFLFSNDDWQNCYRIWDMNRAGAWDGSGNLE